MSYATFEFNLSIPQKHFNNYVEETNYVKTNCFSIKWKSISLANYNVA